MGHDPWVLTRGATRRPDGSVEFRVWAPAARTVAVVTPDCVTTMRPEAHGLYTASVPHLAPGTLYSYLLDEERRHPDPVSRCQPRGVHGPSAVVDPHAFRWTDQGWRGIPLADVVLYELHVGTFTAAGTFTAIIPYLTYLRQEVGVTAVE